MPATEPPEGDAGLRIGEVARRAGVSVSTLRAWERRYGALDPERTPGGHRIYRAEDVRLVRDILDLVDHGWSVAAAARQMTGAAGASTPDATPANRADKSRAALWAAIESFDDQAANRALDDAFSRLAVATVFDEVVVPTLRRLGEGWQEDARAIAREHVGTHVMRTRCIRLLAALGPAAHGDRSAARRAVAMCPEDEMHDLGLLMAACVLASHGWEVEYLGAHTPWTAARGVVATTHPALLLVAAALREPAQRFLAAFRAPRGVVTLLGGAGFDEEDAETVSRSRYHGDGFTTLAEVAEGLVARHGTRSDSTGGP